MLVGAGVVPAPTNILFVFVEEVFMKNVMKNVMLVMVCLLVCASIASADTASINPVSIWRYVAYTNPAENYYYIGTQPSDVLAGQTWSAWVQSGGWACEFRTVLEYDVQASVLGFDSSKVTSAKLNFTAAPDFSAARDAVTVDQVLSWFGYGPAWADMYGYNMQLGVVTNGSTDGTYSVDITDMLKATMDASHASSGIAFRFSTDNDADTQLVEGGPLVAPFSDNAVNFYTGYTFSTPTIEVTYIPEPVTVALLGLGGLFLRRRK